MLRKVRLIAMDAGNACFFFASLVGIGFVHLLHTLFNKRDTGGMAAAFGEWAFGLVVTLPITLPLILIGWLLHRIFYCKPLMLEAMEERNAQLIAQTKES